MPDSGEWLSVYLKGVFMGAADTVPGVSGGTIALITGIYERLIAAITALDPRAMGHLKRLHERSGRRAFVANLVAMDVPFLLTLGAGIATSVLILSTAMHAAIEQVPAPTYAFFFGLIAASAVVLYQHVEVDTPGRAAAAVLGFVLAFAVARETVAGRLDHSPVVMLVAGSIAITAMILPGISGAFLLVLLNQYDFASGLPGRFVGTLIDVVVNGSEPARLLGPGVPIAAFLAGAVVGLLTIAHVVRAALANYREATLAFLVSLMVGALRFPAVKVSEAVGTWSPTNVAVVVVPALVGIALVVGLDRYTDDLDY